MEEQSEPKQAETKKPSQFLNQILIILGWVLIAFSVLVLFGTLQQPLYRDPSIHALLTHPDSYALVGTIGLIIGTSFPSIISCLFGVWVLVRKNPNGMILILASLIIFLINFAILFLPSPNSASVSVNHSVGPTIPQSEYKATLPSSESVGESINRSTVTTTPHSAFTVTFQRPAKKKVVTVAGIESTAYESKGTESAPYFRAEFMDGMHVAAIANDFRTILANHAQLAGLHLPEITETDNSLGKVGTYSGTKKVGDYTFRIYEKMVIYEWSAITCTVVESLETFPSEETVNFLSSIKRK